MLWGLLRAQLIIGSEFFLPWGQKIRELNLMFISTERRGGRWTARWRRPQRAQKDPQNHEGRQAADGDEGRSERRGGEEETHRWERSTQGETSRGKSQILPLDSWPYIFSTVVWETAGNTAHLATSCKLAERHISTKMHQIKSLF